MLGQTFRGTKLAFDLVCVCVRSLQLLRPIDIKRNKLRLG